MERAMKFMEDIAKGMNHLSREHIVHKGKLKKPS
jgi:hypothetical protein